MQKILTATKTKFAEIIKNHKYVHWALGNSGSKKWYCQTENPIFGGTRNFC